MRRALVLLLLLAALPAQAAETLTVGKAAPNSFSFVPLDVGMKEGFFAKQGLDIEEVGLSGSAKLAQAITAGSLDIALGGGTDIIFPVKGAPETAIAAMAGPPLVLGFTVPWNSPAKTADDLKGKRFGVSSVASLTEWLALKLAEEKGWGPNGIKIVTVGAEASSMTAPLISGEIDVLVASAGIGLNLAQQKRARLLFPASDVVQDFITHIIFASNKTSEKRPDAVRGFLKGWFDTIAFMRANKERTVAIARTITGYTPAVEEQEYDLVMPMFSATGRFEPKAMDMIEGSFTDLHLLDKKPDLSKYYTEAFLPGGAGR